MKKLIYTLATLFLAFTFISCEGPEGPMGMQGYDGRQGPAGPQGPQGPAGQGGNWEVIKLTVLDSDWALVGIAGDLNSYYKAEVSVPELTTNIYDRGNVNGYIEFKSSGNAKKYPLPYTLHVGESSALWTETYDFKFETRKVTFYVTYSDFSTDLGRPATETYYIVLTW